jgi:hypothetical protein
MMLKEMAGKSCFFGRACCIMLSEERLSDLPPDRSGMAVGGDPVWGGSGGASLHGSGLGI